MKKIPLLVITGPTASGKTQLSIDIAKRFNGEIVSADSMQVYKGMNIATAKPMPDEQDGVPHHLIDFLEPGASFSAACYAQLAHEVIYDIDSRGALPIMCGGTGLYIQAVVDNLQFSGEHDNGKVREMLRERAEREGAQALWDELWSIDPDTAGRLTPGNLGRVIRALEIYLTTGIRMSEQLILSRSMPTPYDAYILAISFHDRALLYERIDRRVDAMLEAGLVNETREVVSNNDMTTAYQAIGYKELKPYICGEKSLEECVERLKRETRRYAKRQLTWLRRDERTNWIYRDDFSTYDDFFNGVLELLSVGFMDRLLKQQKNINDK